MKKVIVLTMLAFLAGLAAPALAEPGYHEVYKLIEGKWVLNEDCEMFSKDSKTLQYRWESDEAAEPCIGTYYPPNPEFPPPQFTIRNYAHLFPWIDVHCSETGLIWDIFKPGDYMAKTFILGIQANCDVLVHLGGGTWKIPKKFVPEDEVGYQNGHIEFGDFTKDDEDEVAADKKRLYSLLCKDSPGTPTDEIEVRWWWYDTQEKTPPHEITDAEKAIIPTDKTKWTTAAAMNCKTITIKETEKLHLADHYVVFFEDLRVERCDSEGKYYDAFAVTVTPDP